MKIYMLCLWYSVELAYSSILSIYIFRKSTVISKIKKKKKMYDTHIVSALHRVYSQVNGS